MLRIFERQSIPKFWRYGCKYQPLFFVTAHVDSLFHVGSGLAGSADVNHSGPSQVRPRDPLYRCGHRSCEHDRLRMKRQNLIKKFEQVAPSLMSSDVFGINSKDPIVSIFVL